MALSIGTLVGYLQLDDTTFSRKADEADRRMDALRLHLSALAKVNPKVQVDVTTQEGRLDELKARLADLRVQAAKGVDVKVDMVAALVELEAVQAKLREIGAAATADEAKVGRLAAVVDTLGKVKGPSLLMTAILGLGPALVPLAGAAVVAFGAFGVAALGAVAGIGVLKLALSGVGASLQAYQAYTSATQKAALTQQLALGKATKSSQVTAAHQAYASSTAQAQATLNSSAYGTATPALQAFTRSVANGGIANVKSQLTGAAQSSVLPGLAAGIKAALPLTGTLTTAISKIGGALGDMATKSGKALSSPFWRQFFGWLGTTAASDLKLIGSIGGSVFTALARAIERFGPDGTKMLTWIDGLAKKFDGWTAGKGFAGFLAAIHADAKQAVSMFQKLAPSVAAFLKGFASAGPGTFSALGALFTIIGKLPPGVLTTLGKYLPTIVLALKGMQIAGAVAKGIQAIAAAEKVWSVAQVILNAVTEAFPLVLIITAAIVVILLIIKYHKQLERAAVVTYDAIKGAAVAAWHWVESAAQGAWNLMVKFGRWLSSTFTGFWHDILGAIHAVMGAIDTLASKAGSVLSDLNPLKALHIPGFAVGTNDAPGGWTWVGENGPELMNLAPHSQVIPSAKAKALSAGASAMGGAAGQVVYLVLDSGEKFAAYVTTKAQQTVTSDRRYTAMIGATP